MEKMIESVSQPRPAGLKESVAAGGVVVRQEAGRLLVALVCEPPQDGYILPKGSQDIGESLEDTARREILEEAGIGELTLLGKLGVHERPNYRRTSWKIIHYFLFVTNQTTAIPTDKKHAYRCDWYPLDELPTMFWNEQKELIVNLKAEISARVNAHLHPEPGQPCLDIPEQAILNALPDAVLVLDGQRSLRYANPAARALFDCSGPDERGHYLIEQIPLGGRKDVHLELPGCKTLDAEGSCTEILWEGAPAFLISLRDDTVRKQAENEKYTRLLREVQEDLHREQRLTEVTRTISSALELSVILKSIITLTIDLVGADTGALGLIIPETQRMTSPYLFNANENVSELRALPKGEALAWHMLESRHPLLLITKQVAAYTADTEGCGVPLSPLDVLARELAADGVYSVIGAPIAVGENQLGALLLYSLSPEEKFSERLLLLVDSVGRQAGVAIQNARLYEEIREMAITDSLTSLYNRRHFYDLAHREMERAVRYARPLSIIMCDIDHFKKINDTYGHAVGDVVLQSLTALFINSFRQSDILCRFGGEEFVIMMPETELEMAQSVAERIRLEIAENEIIHEGAKIAVTLSFGVTRLGKSCEGTPDELLDQLLQRADKAMYTAKETGRNRVITAPE